MLSFFDNISFLFNKYDITGAFLVNVRLTLWSAIFAFLLGMVLAIMRISPVPSLQRIGAGYVELVRNIPVTVIILACSLGLWGQLGVELADPMSPTFIIDNGFRLSVLGLSAYTATFFCEAIRSGVNTVPSGQAEAARAIGMTFGQSLREVLMPQAIRGAVTPMGSTLVALAKNTTVTQAAGVVQASSFMITAIDQNGDMIVTIFAVVAFGWVLIVLPIGLVTTWLSNKLRVVR